MVCNKIPQKLEKSCNLDSHVHSIIRPAPRLARQVELESALVWLTMGEGDKRPSWTSLLTLDHPLAIFCPHHAEHKRKKEAEAAAAMAIIPATPDPMMSAAVTEHNNPSAGSNPTANATTSSASGCPVMATTPSAESSCGGGGAVSVNASEGGGAASGSGRDAAKSACPVSPESRSVWASLNPSNNMMVEERQMPSPGQETPLPTVGAQLCLDTRRELCCLFAATR